MFDGSEESIRISALTLKTSDHSLEIQFWQHSFANLQFALVIIGIDFLRAFVISVLVGGLLAVHEEPTISLMGFDYNVMWLIHRGVYSLFLVYIAAYVWRLHKGQDLSIDRYHWICTLGMTLSQVTYVILSYSMVDIETGTHIDIPNSWEVYYLFASSYTAMLGVKYPLVALLVFSVAITASVCLGMHWHFGTFQYEDSEFLHRLTSIWFGLFLIICTTYQMEKFRKINFAQLKLMKDANMRADLEINPFSVQNLRRWVSSTEMSKLEDAPHQQPTSPVGGGALARWEIKMEDLVLGEKVTAGSNGMIFKGEYAHQQVAIKQLFTTMLDNNDLSQFSNEVSVLSTLGNCPSIIRMFGISKLEESIFLVMEWCDYTLEDLFSDPSCWPSQEQLETDPVAFSRVLSVAAQLCIAMEFLHANRIAHCDLKPDNVLIATDRKSVRRGTTFSSSPFAAPVKVKLCDFGLASSQRKKKLEMGAIPYLAPELCHKLLERMESDAPKRFDTKEEDSIAMTPRVSQSGRLMSVSAPVDLQSLDGLNPSLDLGLKADVYAYGILLIAMCSGNKVYSDLTDFGPAFLRRVWTGLRPDIPPACPEDLAAIIQQCLLDKPSDRPTFSSIMLALKSISERT